jgi:hypothetical protein
VGPTVEAVHEDRGRKLAHAVLQSMHHTHTHKTEGKAE